MDIKNGLLVVVKEDCPTCQLVVPVLAELAQANRPLAILSQDDLAFLDPVPTAGMATIRLDTSLETSFRLNIETVPTLIKFANGDETDRLVGWHRAEWQAFTSSQIGQDLPDYRPGCGAKNVEPAIKDALTVKYGDVKISSRSIQLSQLEDEIEACYARGWSDGMPLVPPTKIRVYRMLQGTHRDPAEILGHMPHNHAPVSVEKAAVNAVMAGCKPEYFPVVIAAVIAACKPEYGLRAFMASTWFSAPVIVVNGPIAQKIGMESSFSAFGSGNRANATIGRALNLIIRNVGGVLPGEVARSTMGSPGRYSFCFAENENNTGWNPISVERGLPAGRSAVTLLTGDGLQPIADERSRTPDSLAVSLAAGLRAVYHHKWGLDADVILAVSPEHSRVFEQAGWSKQRVQQELESRLIMNTADMVAGAGGCAEGISPAAAAQQATMPKFTPGGIHIVRVGSEAGLYSVAISCWPSGGDHGTAPISQLIDE